MRLSCLVAPITAAALFAGVIDACTHPVPTKPPRVRVLCVNQRSGIYRIYYTNYATFASTKPKWCACALGLPQNTIVRQVQQAQMLDALTGQPLADATGPLFPFQPNANVGRAFQSRMGSRTAVAGFLARVARPVPGQLCVTWCFTVQINPQAGQANLEKLLGSSQLGTTESNQNGGLVAHTFIQKPVGRDPCCVLYYKFDRNVGPLAVNYGNCCAPAQGNMVHVGPAPVRWVAPGLKGAAMLGGSANTTSAHYNYCDTGWRGPVGCSFTVNFWARRRFNPGTSLSYLWGGIGSFRCFTNGVAGTGLWVRSWGGQDLKFPANFQTLAARKQGVCIGLTVNGVTLRGQWYADGVPVGSAIVLTAPALVPASTSSFKIGKHSSNTRSSAYDIDEFRFCNLAASPRQMRLWCLPSAAWAAWGRPCGLWLDCNDGPPVAGNKRYNLCLLGPARPVPFLLALGFAPQTAIDMGIFFGSLKGCPWYVNTTIVLTGATATNGIAKIPLPIPPGVAGARLDVQAFGITTLTAPFGVATSNTLTTRVENQ